MERNRNEDKSYVVVAYIMLLVFILFGAVVGWAGHSIYSENRNKEDCVLWRK